MFLEQLSNFGPVMLQIVCGVICTGLGALSGFFADTFAGEGGSIQWYNALNLPPFRPPNAIFGPVWTVLYVLMGVGLGSIIASANYLLFWLFMGQLALNLIWSPIFFKYRMMRTSFAIILALWLVLIAMIFMSFQSNINIALFGQTFSIAYLFLPYITWITFASTLNGAVWSLNRQYDQ